MKISKLQAGGFATYTPLNSPTVQLPSTGVPSQQASSNNEGEELLSKEVVKQLLENGLMNDVDLYMKNLSNMSTSLMDNPRAASQAMLNQYPQINKIIAIINTYFLFGFPLLYHIILTDSMYNWYNSE